MQSKIKCENLHLHDVDMRYDEINNHTMSDVMHSFMSGSSTEICKIYGYLRVLSNKATIQGTSPWGEPNSWYTSGKFQSSYGGSTAYILVDPEDWLQLHDFIGHDRDGHTRSTAEWVEERIQNNEERKIPTPTLSLEPDKYNEDPLEYVPTKEGRSRGVGAKKAGIDKMPILVSVRRPTA